MEKFILDNILRNIPKVRLKAVADIKIDVDLKSWDNKRGIPLLIDYPYI